MLEWQEIKEPEISTVTDIKVKIVAAGVNPIDTKVRRSGLFYENSLPAVLGCDGAGEIIETGSAVNQFKPGDQVWFCHGGLGREQGNYAEFNVIDQRWISRMPKTLSFTEAAAAPLVLITAWGALFARGGLQSGQTVLIHGAAGGVGHVAIQLAKWQGACVIVTVSNADKAEFARLMGADHVIHYQQADFATEVIRLTKGKGVDLVLDTVGAEVFKASMPATAYFGRLVTLLDPGEIRLTDARMRNLLIGFELMLTPMLRELCSERDRHCEILQQCAALIEQGELKVHVAETYNLCQAVQAHQRLERGHMQGKIALIV